MADDAEILAQLTGENDDHRPFLLANPDLFLLHYFPDRVKRLEDFHLRLIDTACNQVRGLVLYPAGHGKTTLVSTLLPIYWMCQNPNIRIAIIAKNEAEAGGIMRVIQAELLTNEELIRDFGPFLDPDDKNKAWALERMTIAKCTKRMKEATLAVFGSGARTVLGYRTDRTICDDVVTDKNSASQTQRANLRNWFDLAVETGPEAGDAPLTVVGTLFDPEDLYHDLVEMIDPETGDRIWHVQREDAIVETCKCGHPMAGHATGPCGDTGCDCKKASWDDGAKVTLWPWRWPWPRLMLTKAKLGTLNFNKRYRNIAVDASRMVFREEYVKGGWIGKQKFPGCLDRSYRVGQYEPTWKRAAGFDPAVGASSHAKFCAHMTLGVGSCQDHERCYWVIDLERDQFTLPQQSDLIIDKHNEYDLLVSKVEANSFQAGLYQAIEQRMKERQIAYKIEPHYTNRVNKPDPEIGVQAMSRWFENGQVHIPWGDPHSTKKMKQFVEELVMYPGRTTDTVMAFWFAWKALELAAPKYKSFNRLDRPGAPKSPYRRSGRTVKNPLYT